MAAVVFDTGGLIAIDRGRRELGALLAVAAERGIELRTPAACVAQAWRDPSRQVRLARALRGFVEHSLDPAAARRCGLLLAITNGTDVVDASLALLVDDGDTVVTGDRGDIERLLAATGTQARIRAV